MTTADGHPAAGERADAPPGGPGERWYAIIPAYREGGRIGPVVEAARRTGVGVVVVDDGSGDGTAGEAERAGAIVLRHERNRGKGAAMATGFGYAREHGCSGVVALDADGQHDPAEIAKFIETYRRTGLPVLVGNRMWNPEGMPLVRRLTNRWMSWLLSREMNQFVPDTQCGYRMFRCDILPFVAAETEGFAAESEILLKVASRGIQIGSVRISTIYGDERSKIRPLRDTVRFFRMLRAYRAGRRRAQELRRRREG